MQNVDIRQMNIDLIKKTYDWNTDTYCLKRYTEGKRPECGFISINNVCEIYLANIFSLSDITDIRNIRKLEYPDVEAMVDDGWIVD